MSSGRVVANGGPNAADLLSIGEMAMRSGLAPSALRFYESRGLIRAERSAGGQRLYRRSVLRRLAVIRVAQRIGLTLTEIGVSLDALPADRAPSRAEWERLSREWRKELDERMAILQGLREDLAGCIGCGCLSLQRCRLYNPADAAATLGTGPRYLLGDRSEEVIAAVSPANRQAAASDADRSS